MTNRAAIVLILLSCWIGVEGCGPSAQEAQLQRQNTELHKDVAQQRQYIADLRQRIQLTDARNRVLIDLVQGLTGAPQQAGLMPAHSSLAALDQDLERLIGNVQHSREDMEALRAQRNKLSDELSQAKHTIEGARAEEAQINARLAAFRAMLSQLSSLIDHGDLDVRIARNRMVLQLPEAVLYESGQARISRGGQVLLDKLAEVLRSVALREFQIAGHTDSVPLRPGRYQSNWQLSAARAIEVMQYLVSRGVARERLSAAAYGDTQPLADNASPEGRQKNRRTEIVLLPNLDELPDLSALNDLLQRPAAGGGSSTLPAPAASAPTAGTPPVPALTASDGHPPPVPPVPGPTAIDEPPAP